MDLPPSRSFDRTRVRELLAEDQSILALGMDIREVEKLDTSFILVSHSHMLEILVSGCEGVANGPAGRDSWSGIR